MSPPQDGHNLCTVYSSNGDIEMTGAYILEDSRRAAAREELHFAAGTQSKIYLQGGRALIPVDQLVPSGLPNGVQRAENGVYAACSRIGKDRLECQAFDVLGRSAGTGTYKLVEGTELPMEIRIFDFGHDAVTLKGGTALSRVW